MEYSCNIVTKINSDAKYIHNSTIVMMFCTDFNSDKGNEIINQ